ncbi:Nn.00g080850.m01.CDS01 [Neocucurbitaria sp. VM-36]
MSAPVLPPPRRGPSSFSSGGLTLVSNTSSVKSQWDLAIERKIHKLKRADSQRLQKLLECDEQSQALQHMIDEYTKKGFAALIQRFEPLFLKLQDFSTAVTTMVQSQGLASLIWGSVQFVLLSTLRYIDIFDKIITMLNDLVETLPRFEIYLSLFPTPELQRAIWQVYDDYVGFCLDTAAWLSNKPLYNLVRMLWSSVQHNFERTIRSLRQHKVTFIQEAGLAEAVEAKRRHDDLKTSLAALTLKGTRQSPMALLPCPRNLHFCGREGILHDMEQTLSTSKNNYELSSVALHGIGGIGKTQIALEYTFKYRGSYSSIFWARAETEATLVESFAHISRRLNLAPEDTQPRSKVELVRVWLETNADWLLVFDNADSPDSLRPYWPSALNGSIILTTQNPDFSSWVTLDIHVPPFTNHEGSDLVLKQLKRSDNERDSAIALSEELGGLPLAISHFTGYAARSSASVREILSTMQKSQLVSGPWESRESLAVGHYEKTLRNVWDLALSEISEGGRQLLNILAFLNPDAVPEVMFLGDIDVLGLGDDIEARISALRAIVYGLREHHLIERDFSAEISVLRIHRVLQSSILRRLNEAGKLQETFEKAFEAVRQVFPKITFLRRNNDLWPTVELYLPHVLSLQRRVELWKSVLRPSIDFADLLCDASTFLYMQSYYQDAMPMLYLAETTCRQLLKADDPSPVLAQILESIGCWEECFGLEPRKKAVPYLREVVDLRERYHRLIKPDDMTVTDQVTLARSWADLAQTLLSLDQVPEAVVLFDRAFMKYSAIGTEETLPYRFAHEYNNLAWCRVCQGEFEEALLFAEKSHKLAAGELGAGSPWTLIFRFGYACILLISGDLDRALVAHTELLMDRIEHITDSNPDTLLSYYFVAVVHYYRGELEAAERNLREALRLRARASWPEVEAQRAAFLLVMLLCKQGRHEAAREVEKTGILRKKERSPIGLSEAELEIEMAKYDFEVSIWHGRSEGRCKPRL